MLQYDASELGNKHEWVRINTRLSHIFMKNELLCKCSSLENMIKHLLVMLQ